MKLLGKRQRQANLSSDEDEEFNLMAQARKRFITNTLTEAPVLHHHHHHHRQTVLDGADAETKTLLTMLPAPHKDDASNFIVPDIQLKECVKAKEKVMADHDAI